MEIKNSIQDVFAQLEDSLQLLSDKEYAQPTKVLFNATIGQHVRHIIELYICLYQGYESGIVNYEKRKRDTRIETDKNFANELMDMIANNLNKANKDLVLEAGYDENSSETMLVATNYKRELIYNLEHTVHHMALIRVGINEVSLIKIPDGFGVASSTIKYRKECAQ